GGKAIKMVYAPAGSEARVTTVEVPEADRQRFCLSDADLEILARQALVIEEHYGRPMDIEGGKDGSTGEIFILQARPEQGQRRGGRRCRVAPVASFSAIPSRAAHRCWRAAAASASASAPGPRASSATSARSRACRRATCWSPTSPIPTGSRS